MKIICIGHNYISPEEASEKKSTKTPFLFIKPKNALLLSDALIYPEFTNELHCECELVLRVSKNGRYIHKSLASNYYDGVSVGFSFTAKDIQQQLINEGLPWDKAKSFDNSAAVGKFIELTSDINLKNLSFILYKNKNLVHMGNSNQMIFHLDHIVAEVSKYFTINIGDFIFTGTPVEANECVCGDVLEGYLENEMLLRLGIK